MLSLKEITILSGVQTENRRKCQHCGHTRLLGFRDKVVCNHCGHYIFKDKQAEFNYRMRERMLKTRKEEENEI